MADRQLFIIGTGRSGTTILREILGHHSKIHVYPHELRFLTDAGGLVDLVNALTRDWNPFNASKAIEDFEDLLLEYMWKEPLHHMALSLLYQFLLRGAGREYRFIDLRKVVPLSHCQEKLAALIDELTMNRVSGYWLGASAYEIHPEMYVTRRLDEEELYPILGRFVDELLSYPMRGTAQTVWCDDTPINIMNADRIARMLDSARLLHLYRDPRDVVASYADPAQTWAPDDPELSAVWVREIMMHWLEMRERIPDNQYVEIRYEDLVTDQEKHLRTIVQFAGVEFEDALMNIQLTRESVGRYKDDIPPHKLSSVEKHVAPILEAFYENYSGLG